jgi:hypothetical protein
VPFYYDARRNLQSHSQRQAGCLLLQIPTHATRGPDCITTLPDVPSDIVIAWVRLSVDAILVLRPTDAFKVAGLIGLAGTGIQVPALFKRDLAIIARSTGARAVDYVCTWEPPADGFVDA